MFACLSALERIKEDEIFFLVIMETSDSKWHQAPAVKKSRSAFQPYYVSKASYKEAINEIVNKWKPFSKKDYDTIYDNIGGHLGSYSQLLELMNTSKIPLIEALEELENLYRYSSKIMH